MNGISGIKVRFATRHTNKPIGRYAKVTGHAVADLLLPYHYAVTPIRHYADTPPRPYADMSSRYSREFLSLDIELQIVQPAIHRRRVQKLAMGTNFSDLTSLHDDDLVGL